jgi:hypothetical protein
MDSPFTTKFENLLISHKKPVKASNHIIQHLDGESGVHSHPEQIGHHIVGIFQGTTYMIRDSFICGLFKEVAPEKHAGCDFVIFKMVDKI